MTRVRNYESRNSQRRIFKPLHDAPGDIWYDYILLPYGAFYEKTRTFFDAKKGDKMRFMDGVEVRIDSVTLIEDEHMCDILSRMRYGVRWAAAFKRWMSYARLEGHGKDILVPDKCIMVVYGKEIESNK